MEHECGGTKATTDFFRDFQFTAAMPDLDRYEIQLRSQIVPSDTDQSGWLLLRDNVTRWAILKGRPNPDGRILREHIVSLISKKRPRPISQNFLVPDDFAPPDPGFEEQVRSRIGDRETSLTVVWGTPGRGKSTFLSYLFNELKREKKAVVSAWKMPIPRALDELLVNIPLIQGLCDIKPVAKPKWLDDSPSDCLTSGLQESRLFSFFNSEKFLNSGVLSFVSPFDTKDAKYGHISASLLYASPDFKVAEPNDVYQPAILVDSSKDLSFEGLWPTRQMSNATMGGSTGDAVPVCNEIMPMPFGHWMGNYFQTGFPTVASYLLDTEHQLRVRNGSVELVIGDHVRATTSVWHDEWTQHYARGGGNSRNGVYVSVSPEFAECILSKPPTGLKAGWFVKYEVWQRERDFDDYVSKSEHKFVFTGMSS